MLICSLLVTGLISESVYVMFCKVRRLFNRAAMGRARFLLCTGFFNRAAMGRARFLLCTGFFFFRFCVTRRRSPRMMSSSTNHRPNSHSAKCRHRLMSSSADKYDRIYCNALTVINKIVFTSPEAMVEFSGKKI